MAGWILFGIFALIVAINAAVCAVKGLNKSVIRLMFVVLAVVLTFLVAAPVTTLITNSITVDGDTLGELLLDSINTDDAVEIYFDTVPLLKEMILVIPALAVGLVVFPLVFGLFSLVAWIACRFAQEPLRKLIFKENRTREEEKQLPKKQRMISIFSGMGVGIVTGMIVFGMLFTPLFGLCGMLPTADAVDDVVKTLKQQDVLSRSDAEAVQEAYGITDSAMVNFYGFVGGKATGKAYIDAATRIEVDGVTTSLGNELGNLLDISQVLLQSDLLKDLEDPEALYDLLADEDTMEQLLQSLFQSETLRTSVPDVMAAVMKDIAWTMNIDEDVAEDLASDIRKATKKAISDKEDAEETAEVLASVSSDIAKAVSKATDKDGLIDTSELDYNKIGKAVKKLQKSSMKKFGSCVIDIFGASDGTGTLSGMMSDIKKEYDAGEDISDAVPAVIELSNLAANGADYFSQNSIEVLFACASESDAVYDMLAEVSTDPFCLEIRNPDARQAFADDILNVYLTTGRTDKDVNIALGIGRLLGVENELYG